MSIVTASSEWTKRWPNHCRHCHGWGGFTYYENHGDDRFGPGEQVMEPCGAIDDLRTCHRCGWLGLTADGDGPCGGCGWNYDDGDPAL